MIVMMMAKTPSLNASSRLVGTAGHLPEPRDPAGPKRFPDRSVARPARQPAPAPLRRVDHH
jgi:hypothetical protein